MVKTAKIKFMENETEHAKYGLERTTMYSDAIVGVFIKLEELEKRIETLEKKIK